MVCKNEIEKDCVIVQSFLVTVLSNSVARSSKNIYHFLSKVNNLRASDVSTSMEVSALISDIESLVLTTLKDSENREWQKFVIRLLGSSHVPLGNGNNSLFGALRKHIYDHRDAVYLAKNKALSEVQRRQIIEKGLSLCKNFKNCISYYCGLKRHCFREVYVELALKHSLRFAYDSRSCFMVFERSVCEVTKEKALHRALRYVNEGWLKRLGVLYRIYSETSCEETKRIAVKKFGSLHVSVLRRIRESKIVSRKIYLYQISVGMGIGEGEALRILEECVANMLETRIGSFKDIFSLLKSVPGKRRKWLSLAELAVNKAKSRREVLEIKELCPHFKSFCDERLADF